MNDKVNISLSPLQAVKLSVIIKEYLRALNKTIERQESHLPNVNQDLELDVIACCEVQISAALADIPNEQIFEENINYAKAFVEKQENEAKNN